MANRSLKQQAYENIKKMITSDQISYENPFTELQLCKTLKIGRSPIREALNLLSKDGLIQLIPNKGAVLKKFSFDDLIQIYQIREVLDPLATKQAAGKIDLFELEKIEKKYLPQNCNWELGRQFSQELHSLIYKSSCNPYLIEVFENLHCKIEVSRHSLWNLWVKSGENELMERRKKEHAGIIQSLKEGDGKNAEKRSKEHISNAIKDTIKIMVGDGKLFK